MPLIALLLAFLFPGLVAPPGPCSEIVVGQMYGCADQRAYVLDARGWHDAGPLTPVVVLVPALPER